MANTVYKNSYFVNGAESVETQSILDIFVVQGQVTQADAEKIKSQFKTNREIENFLLKNRVVSPDTINKAYSILLKLPFVSLKNLKIPKEALLAIPINVAKKYNVIAFGTKEKNLMLAVSRPGDLNVNFSKGLEKILGDRYLNVEMYITGKDDFSEAIKQYSGSGGENLIQKTSFPTVYLRNQNISKSLLNKFPHDFVEKFKAVVFLRQKDGSYALAAQNPDDPMLVKALREVEDKNSIKFQVFSTSKDDIDYVLDKIPNINEDPQKNSQPKTIKIEPQIGSESSDKKVENDKPKDKSNDDEMIDFGGLFSSFLGGDDKKEKTLVIDDHKKIDDKQEKEEPAKSEQKKPEGKDGDESTDDKENNDKQSDKEGEQNSDGSNNLGDLLDHDIKSKEDLENLVIENFVPKLVAGIINYALNQRASDIHFEAIGKDLRIRYRIDGILTDILHLSLKLQPPIISRIKILSSMKIDETRIPQDGRFDVVFKDQEVDVRVSSMPTVHGEKIVLRILDKNQGILSLEDLGMKGRAFDLTVEAMKKPYGVILSTGPTGSGKSTTLYAIINRVSVPAVNIVTLEDPVEYEIPGVNQCQVKPSIGFTFAEGLRSVLRQDPNVIMVGEIRDGETAGMVTHAALTGHLVLSTLHTNNAAGALPRLINMGVEPFLITSAINLVIAQRLVRRICPKCKEEAKIPQKLMEIIQLEISKIPEKNVKDRERAKKELKFYHGVGCSECSHGFRGRIGLFEALRITEEVEELAIGRKPANDIRKASVADGMIMMRQDGILKAMEGLTTIDEVLQATST